MTLDDPVMRVAHKPALRECAFQRAKEYWKVAGLPEKWLPRIFEILGANARSEAVALRAILACFPQLTDPSSDYSTALREYRASKVTWLAGRLSRHIRGPLLLDFGGRRKDLASALLKACRALRHVIVCDIRTETSDEDIANVRFLAQQSAETIPLEDASVDTVLAIMVLHHVPPVIRTHLLDEIGRVLRPGGRFVALEDTYAEDPSCYRGSQAWLRRFAEFPEVDKTAFLAFFDWFGNALMRGRVNEVLPFAFESIENWQKQIEALSYRTVEVVTITSPACPFDLMPPKGILVAERR